MTSSAPRLAASPGSDWPTTSPALSCCPIANSTGPQRNCTMTSTCWAAGSGWASRPCATGFRRCNAPSNAAYRSSSCAPTRPETSQSGSRPRHFISAGWAAAVRCGWCTTRSPSRAGSSCRWRRCPTAGRTSGWPRPPHPKAAAIWASARASPSDWAATSPTPTSWSTPPGSSSTIPARRSRSGRAARSATGRHAPNARFPISAAGSWSTKTRAAACPIRPPANRLVKSRQTGLAGAASGVGCCWGRTGVAEESGVTDFDYCVVGAGFAGLTAALRLKQAGRSVALLEARDRVGGRTWTVTRDDGVWIDRGGAWIGPGQDRIYALMEEFGVPEYKQHNDGDAMMIVGGKKHRYGGTIPWTMSPWAAANLGVALMTVEQMCKTIPREAPWEAKDAAEWDRTSIGDWLERNVLSKQAREMLDMALAGPYTTAPSETSLLWMLLQMGSAGGPTFVISGKGGA